MSEPRCTPQPCCGDAVDDRTGKNASERPVDLPPSVTGEVAAPEGSVPVVSRRLDAADRLGIWKARWGIRRMKYTVAPGLYAAGDPGADSEVLVTANYRMTFDLLRSALEGINAWILVLDTKGINVWCAAGKGTFGTDELVGRVRSSGLEKVVSHRRLIVPQLGAPGVAAHEVRARTGFEVVYGPVESQDIPAYLEHGRNATAGMRRKGFPFSERAAIVPMELVPALRWVVCIAAAVALVSGLLGKGAFTDDAFYYGSRSFMSLAAGTLAGAVAAPLLLPWLPGRAFALKGAVTGAAAAFLMPLLLASTGIETAAWTLVTLALSSYLAMNFTGSSTYTSLSGVRKEMKSAVPFQITAATAALALWLGALFTGGGSL